MLQGARVQLKAGEQRARDTIWELDSVEGTRRCALFRVHWHRIDWTMRTDSVEHMRQQ